MLYYSRAYQCLRQALMPLYDPDEAGAIAREVMLAATGKTYLQSIGREVLLSAAEERRLQAWTTELAAGRPMQYVLGEAWFMDRKYVVDERVLIPRPETEELVQWITDDYKNGDGLSVLDIGTGSGCISISLKLALSGSTVTACDISGGALAVASKNAAAHQAAIEFREMDFLDIPQQDLLGRFEVIVSNPPYIPASEQRAMHRNVTAFEPHTALFVPDNDPQRFYSAIALFGQRHLSGQGAVYCELHRDYALETVALFKAAGYQDVRLRHDLNGHPRMLKAIRP